MGVYDVLDKWLLNRFKALNIGPFDAGSLIQNCVYNCIYQLLVQFRKGLPALLLILVRHYISLRHAWILLTDLWLPHARIFRLIGLSASTEVIILRDKSNLLLGWLPSPHILILPIILLRLWSIWIKLTFFRLYKYRYVNISIFAALTVSKIIWILNLSCLLNSSLS